MKRSTQSPIYQYFKKQAKDINYNTVDDNTSSFSVQPSSSVPSAQKPSAPLPISIPSVELPPAKPPSPSSLWMSVQLTASTLTLTTASSSSQSLTLNAHPPLSPPCLCQPAFVLPTIQISTETNNQSTQHTIEIIDPHSSADPNDIGRFINRIKELDDNTKFNIIKASWQPPSTFKFPYSFHWKRNQEEKRYVNQNYLNNNEWLAYSDIHKGLFCKYCVVFADFCGAGKARTDKFVLKPLTTFAKLTGKDGELKIHETSIYHRNSVVAADSFCTVFKDPAKSIVNLITTDRMKVIEDNRQRLRPIIETIILMGRQNIAFRGRRDDGRIDLEDEEEHLLQNEGNFRELLRFRVKAGDSVLENHLKNSASNATYISKTTQNQLIEVIGEVIRENILNRIRKVKYFSVMFDETTDVSTISQLSLVLTYVFEKKRFEDFVEFVDVHDLVFENREAGQEPKVTGKILGQLVLKRLKHFGLNLESCVGIATDGCSVMTSEKVGAVQEVQSEATNAAYCGCYNHALNLSIAVTSKVLSIRNSIGVIKETISFLTSSAKRRVLVDSIYNHRIRKLCETRWIERIESIAEFCSNLESIIDILDEISEWEDSVASNKAKSLTTCLTKFEFLIALHCQVLVLHFFCP